MGPIVVHCSTCGGLNGININSLPFSSVSELSITSWRTY
jgi:hypothetical protein